MNFRQAAAELGMQHGSQASRGITDLVDKRPDNLDEDDFGEAMNDGITTGSVRRDLGLRRSATSIPANRRSSTAYWERE